MSYDDVHLRISLSENARKNMAGRIYAAYVARGAVTSTSIELYMDKAVQETDSLLSKLELPK